ESSSLSVFMFLSSARITPTSMPVFTAVDTHSQPITRLNTTSTRAIRTLIFPDLIFNCVMPNLSLPGTYTGSKGYIGKYPLNLESGGGSLNFPRWRQVSAQTPENIGGSGRCVLWRGCSRRLSFPG